MTRFVNRRKEKTMKTLEPSRYSCPGTLKVNRTFRRCERRSVMQECPKCKSSVPRQEIWFNPIVCPHCRTDLRLKPCARGLLVGLPLGVMGGSAGYFEKTMGFNRFPALLLSVVVVVFVAVVVFFILFSTTPLLELKP